MDLIQGLIRVNFTNIRSRSHLASPLQKKSDLRLENIRFFMYWFPMLNSKTIFQFRASPYRITANAIGSTTDIVNSQRISDSTV